MQQLTFFTSSPNTKRSNRANDQKHNSNPTDSDHFSKAPILPNVQYTGNSQSVVSCLQNTTGNNNEIEFYQVVETNRVNLQISAIGTSDPLNNFHVLDCTKHLNIAEEQKKDSEIQQVRTWINNRKSLPRTKYLTLSQRIYIKQLERLCVNNDIVNRKFFNHAGHVSHKQILVPKYLRYELLYRMHNSPEASHPNCLPVSETLPFSWISRVSHRLL